MEARQELEALLAIESPTAADVAKAEALASELQVGANVKQRLDAMKERREWAHPTEPESLAQTEGAREIAEAMQQG